jgi:hypothetical protein
LLGNVVFAGTGAVILNGSLVGALGRASPGFHGR